METPYETEREAALAKALLEIGGECIGTTSPGEYARMALDEVYPGRAEGSTMPPRVWQPGMSLADEAEVPSDQWCLAPYHRFGEKATRTRPQGHPGDHMADYGDEVTSWPQEDPAKRFSITFDGHTVVLPVIEVRRAGTERRVDFQEKS